MRFWIGVSAAFGAGTLIGIGTGILLVEDKLKKEYKEATASHWRAVQAAKIDAETPALTEEDLVEIRPKDPDTVQIISDAKIESVSVNVEGGPEHGVHPITDISTLPQTDNPYHTAVARTEGQSPVYASYAELSEEDFQEDDGRSKEQLTMLFSDNEPMFFMNGAEIEVSIAMDMVGSTIVDDMRAAVQEGNPFVWRRNNTTETDYEVVFEQP